MHQHLFKLGWLLTDNFENTTVLYYILFLPGIVLHELSLWLVAGVLNVRAERALRFPERQDIGELRLNFIRLAPGTGALKLIIITLAPIAAGLAALWLITTRVFDWNATAALLAPGTLDALAAALSSLTTTADFWLWFYLAFVIANTMFPSLPLTLSRRQMSALLAAAPLIAFLGWRLGGEVNADIALAIEALFGGLAILLIQVSLMNALIALALGSAEALIERVSGRSATFTDGVMRTMSRAEALALREEERRAAAAKLQGPDRQRTAPALKSIYDFNLPIPGPPGREPISRQAVAVVDVRTAQANTAAVERRVQRPPPVVTGPPASDTDIEDTSNTASRAEFKAPAAAPLEAVTPAIEDVGPSEAAPFIRPFVGTADDTSEEEHLSGDGEVGGGPFPRPFSMPTRASDSSDATLTNLPHMQPAESARLAESAPLRTARTVSRTRPAPKPARQIERDKPAPENPGELTYEPVDDGDGYVDDDEARDPEL